MHHSITPRNRKKAQTVAGVVGLLPPPPPRPHGIRHVSSHSDGGRAWKRVLIYVRLAWRVNNAYRGARITNKWRSQWRRRLFCTRWGVVRGLKSRFRAWLTTPRSRHPRKTSRHFDARYFPVCFSLSPLPIDGFTLGVSLSGKRCRGIGNTLACTACIIDPAGFALRLEKVGWSGRTSVQK